jgi:hypothetical protein
MRTLKIIEHVSLDGVMQVSDDDSDPLRRLDHALSDSRWPGRNIGRAWREIRLAARPSHLR